MEENLDSSERQTEENPRSRIMAPLLVVAFVALVALGWLAAQRFLARDLSAPTPTTAATPEPAPTTALAAAQPTATATQVMVEAIPTSTPTPTAMTAQPAVVEVREPVFSERIRNGSFENSFKDRSVGLGWKTFNNGSAIFEFLDETWPPAVFDGEHAQRIQVREASQPDRYAGIYQTVNVIPGDRYDLILHGQIRTGSGDITVSEYGYRMQLGLDYTGGQDWMAVKDWIELPWDEQPFDSDLLFFYDYATPVVPTGPRVTIFIRIWNKWADPGRVEYTLDGISLWGPALPEEIALNEPLPETGDAPPALSGWVRVVASALVLGLLLAGAIWQVRRQSS